MSLTHNGVEYDSQEEVDFQCFLEQAKELGYVRDVKYQPETFELVPKSFRTITKRFKTKPDRQEKRTLFQAHNYTPDWELTFTSKFLETYPNHKLILQNPDNLQILEPGDCIGDALCLIDIKGKWNLHGGDRIFPIHQKLMWLLKQRAVNKLIPEKFFKHINLVPDEVKWMKNRKQPTPKKAYIHIPSFSEKYGQQETTSKIRKV
jgi:hypothetical protein